MRMQIETFTRDNVVWKGILTTSEAIVNRLRQRSDGVSSNIKGLQNALAKIKAEVERVDSELKTMRTDFTTARTQLATARTELATACGDFTRRPNLEDVQRLVRIWWLVLRIRCEISAQYCVPDYGGTGESVNFGFRYRLHEAPL